MANIDNEINYLLDNVEDKIKRGLDITKNDLSDKLKLDALSIHATLMFMICKPNEFGWFIPTGSSSKPDGISTTKSDFIVFVDENGELINYFSVKTVKDHIKDNWSVLKKMMDEDYKTQGVCIDVEKI